MGQNVGSEKILQNCDAQARPPGVGRQETAGLQGREGHSRQNEGYDGSGASGNLPG